MSSAPDPYTILGVPRTATQEEINSAYRGLVRQHHPDGGTVADDSPATLERVLAAYAILRDPERRAEYDRLHAPPVRVTERPARPSASGPRTRMTIRVSPVRYHGPGTD